MNYVMEQSYSVTVRYSGSDTLRRLLAEGSYGWVNPEIENISFPAEREGEEMVKINLVCFEKPIQTEEAAAELELLELRPANLVELLAFGAEHPDVQLGFPIAALDQTQNGGRYVGCLLKGPVIGWRIVDLCPYGPAWSYYVRFAGIRQ